MAGAARDAGAEIHTDTAVERIVIANNRVTAVVAGGREWPADVVVSGVDPKTTFLRLVDAADLMPEFRARVVNYRARGTTAKINLALSALPAFTGAADPRVLRGRVHIGPTLDYLEQAFDHAKYGEMSASPWLDIAIPSTLDDTLAPSGAHVMSISVHYAPYALRD